MRWVFYYNAAVITLIALVCGGAREAGSDKAESSSKLVGRTQDDEASSISSSYNETADNKSISDHGSASYYTAQEECGIWLAPSTNGGIGMYAGRHFVKGDDVGSGDPVIAIWDFRLHQPEAGDFLPFQYTWDAWSLKTLGRRQGVNETEPSVNVWSPGLGSAAKPATDRLRINVQFRAPTLDSAGVHQSRGPGTGAFTYHHNRRGLASTDIDAGQELFVDYGESWFHARDLDYGEPWFRTRERQSGGNNVPVGYFDKSIRDKAWFEKHGTCGDHLVPGTSSIPHAGRGAFASRHLPAGTVVAQLPLVHILRRSLLNMKEGHGQQLLLNYCFGHRKSTLLLCPYGPMASLVNHGANHPHNNSTAEARTANVRLQWSDPARSIHDPSLLLQPVQALLRGKNEAKLAMDLIATREIAKGEEVLLDYGKEWERAWQAHEEQWNQTVMECTDTYDSAERLNDETTRIRTVFERLAGNEEYPTNVELFCDNTFRKSGWRRNPHERRRLDEFLSENIGELVPCDVLRYHEFGNGTVFYTAVVYGENEDESYLLEDVPRPALAFRDVPYSTDDLASTVFRHDIRIPDDLFPDAWRNRR